MLRGKVNLLERFFRRIEIRDELSSEEKEALLVSAGERRSYVAGSNIVLEGDRPNISTLLLDGLASRYNLTQDGRRQITAIHVPGDFVDLHSFPLKRMDHSVGAITDCETLTFPHSALRDITERQPHLTRLLWMLTLVDAAIHRSWLVSMGRTPALAHLAHFICETYARLEVVGLAADLQMDFPITQGELADVLGISSVHVNRMLQELRADNLVVWKGNEVTLRNWSRLVDVGQFDPTYLFLERLPR